MFAKFIIVDYQKYFCLSSLPLYVAKTQRVCRIYIYISGKHNVFLGILNCISGKHIVFSESSIAYWANTLCFWNLQLHIGQTHCVFRNLQLHIEQTHCFIAILNCISGKHVVFLQSVLVDCSVFLTQSRKCNLYGPCFPKLFACAKSS